MVTSKPTEQEPKQQIRILQRPKNQRADPPKVKTPETTEIEAAVHPPVIPKQKKNT